MVVKIWCIHTYVILSFVLTLIRILLIITSIKCIKKKFELCWEFLSVCQDYFYKKKNTKRYLNFSYRRYIHYNPLAHKVTAKKKTRKPLKAFIINSIKPDETALLFYAGRWRHNRHTSAVRWKRNYVCPSPTAYGLSSWNMECEIKNNGLLCEWDLLYGFDSVVPSR